MLASNFRDGGEYVRTHGTATWAALESAVGVLEGGQAIAFASGMAAGAIVYALAPKVVVVPTFSYLGLRSLLTEYQLRGHVELRPVDISDTAEVVAAATGADVVWVETPTNLTLVERLRAHPAVAEVRYPGEGAIVSFVVDGGAAAADALCAGVRVVVAATSLGGVETTIERRQKYAATRTCRRVRYG